MIWIIGGTSNANHICRLLLDFQCPIVVSVTTDYGRELAQSTACTVILGELDAEKMNELVDRYAITLIIDASHPFATQVSQNAIQLAKDRDIAYFRFERPEPKFENIRYFESYKSIVDYLTVHSSGNIFITTGTKHCNEFICLDNKRLFIRVLSTVQSVSLCQLAGFLPEQIFAMTGVFSREFNRVLMSELSIRFLITKDSGTEGGLVEKITAAQDVGAEVLVLKRPSINYPLVYSNYDDIIAAVNAFLFF